jgi:hypothetical protein
MPEATPVHVSPEHREITAFRYGLIAAAGCTSLALVGLLLGESGSLHPLAIGFFAVTATVLAIAAAGLVRHHAWAAYLLAAAAFLMAPILAFGILIAIASSVLPSPYNTSQGGIDPEDVIIGVSLPAALVAGSLAIRLGRSLRRRSVA